MVGLFTVAGSRKKNQLKLVVVSCVASVLHRPPPHADNCRFLPKAPGFIPSMQMHLILVYWVLSEFVIK